MKYIVTRIDYNHVKAEVEGYYPVQGTYEAFFDELNSYINRACFVNKVQYQNHSLFIEKLDQECGFLYTDEYVLDGILESDTRFMEYMSSFLKRYEERKEKLHEEVENEMANRSRNMKILKIARHLYDIYCLDSEIEVIEDKSIARDVVKMFEKENPLIYTSISCTMEGDIYTRPRYRFKTDEIKKLQVATGASGIATGVLLVSTLALSNPIIAVAGVATGVGCYCANKKRKEVNDTEAKRTLQELARIYGKLYPEEASKKLIKK